MLPQKRRTNRKCLQAAKATGIMGRAVNLFNQKSTTFLLLQTNWKAEWPPSCSTCRFSSIPTMGRLRLQQNCVKCRFWAERMFPSPNQLFNGSKTQGLSCMCSRGDSETAVQGVLMALLWTFWLLGSCLPLVSRGSRQSTFTLTFSQLGARCQPAANYR